MSVLITIAELIASAVMLWLAYLFITQDGRPREWWSFLPFKTSYITGYRYALDNWLADR